MELKVCCLGAVRLRTFICCRNVRISASSAAHDRNRSAIIQTMSLTRSLIPQQHRPILDQLLVRLSLRQGQLDKEPAIMVREPDATRQPTPHDIQLMSKHRVLSFKPQLRLEWRSQDGQNETEQPIIPPA